MSKLSLPNQKVDATEQLVYDYLRHQGYTEIAYEPDGKVPPDFLVNGRIAVEARRLNQNYAASSRPHGLEEDARPLWESIEKLALSLGPPLHGKSWFLFLNFRRPIKIGKQLKTAIRSVLQSFIISPSEENTEIEIDRSLSLELFPASVLHATFYVMGGQMDLDSGGWMLAEVERNLRLCIREKTEKRNKNAKQYYPEWWLVLSDHIGYGLASYDREQLREQVSFSHDWDRIVLINPLNHTCAFKL